MKPEPDDRCVEGWLCGFNCPYLMDTMDCDFYRVSLNQLDDGAERCQECYETKKEA